MENKNSAAGLQTVVAEINSRKKFSEPPYGKEIRISSIRRVRFKLPVEPGQALSISLSPVDKLNPYSYQFRAATRGETICTGVLIAEELRESKKGPDLC